MRFYNISDAEIWGKNPIPTTRLDVLWDNMLKIEGLEAINQINIANTKLPPGTYYDADKTKDDIKYRNDKEAREADKKEENLKGLRRLAAMSGQTISQETEDAYRGK